MVSALSPGLMLLKMFAETKAGLRLMSALGRMLTGC